MVAPITDIFLENKIRLVSSGARAALNRGHRAELGPFISRMNMPNDCPDEKRKKRRRRGAHGQWGTTRNRYDFNP